MDGTIILLTGFICFGAGDAFASYILRRMLVDKANTGIRWECWGKLYTIQEVET